MKKYHKLGIKAKDPQTMIYIADLEGHLVQQDKGLLKTSLLPGTYAVFFGSNRQERLVNLKEDTEIEEGVTHKADAFMVDPALNLVAVMHMGDAMAAGKEWDCQCHGCAFTRQQPEVAEALRQGILKSGLPEQKSPPVIFVPTEKS